MKALLALVVGDVIRVLVEGLVRQGIAADLCVHTRADFDALDTWTTTHWGRTLAAGGRVGTRW